MPRGGRRQGTQGNAYSNRTDLMNNYGPNGNPASGNIPAPAEQRSLMSFIGADQVPNLSDPTERPNEPITAGLPFGPGPGPEVLPAMPPAPTDPVRQILQALILISPNPDLMRALDRLDYEGR